MKQEQYKKFIDSLKIMWFIFTITIIVFVLTLTAFKDRVPSWFPWLVLGIGIYTMSCTLALHFLIMKLKNEKSNSKTLIKWIKIITYASLNRWLMWHLKSLDEEEKNKIKNDKE